MMAGGFFYASAVSLHACQECANECAALVGQRVSSLSGAYMKRRTFCAIFASIVGVFALGLSPARALDEPQAAAFVDQVVKAAFAELGRPNLTIEQRRQVARGLVERYSDVAQVVEGLVG